MYDFIRGIETGKFRQYDYELTPLDVEDLVYGQLPSGVSMRNRRRSRAASLTCADEMQILVGGEVTSVRGYCS
jgi:hypothetical protein